MLLAVPPLTVAESGGPGGKKGKEKVGIGQAN